MINIMSVMAASIQEMQDKTEWFYNKFSKWILKGFILEQRPKIMRFNFSSLSIGQWSYCSKKTFSSVFSSKKAKCINKDINTLKIERIRNNENPLDPSIVAATWKSKLYWKYSSSSSWKHKSLNFLNWS